MFAPGALLPILQSWPARGRYLLAYSGGMDSTVLVHALAELQGRSPVERVRVVHVDHGLQPAAADWPAHCRSVCDGLGLDLTVLAVDARPGEGESPEEAARRARYGAIAGMMDSDEIVLLGQHLDDQVETLMLRLLRGAGSAGLGAMSDWRTLGRGWLGRPLLRWRRHQLRNWALGRRLHWIEDPTNRDTRFDRNFLRHEVLPLVRQRFGGFEQPVSRAADNLRDDARLLEQIAEADLAAIASDAGDALDLGGLWRLGPLRRRNALRLWLRRVSGQAPRREALNEILSLFESARADAQPRYRLGEGELRRYRGRLYYRASQDSGGDWWLSWDGASAVRLPGSGRRVSPESLREEGVDWAGEERLRFGSRHPGLRVRLRGAAHSRPLKKLMQESGIPPWERSSLALLWAGDRVVWVERLGAVEGFEKSR